MMKRQKIKQKYYYDKTATNRKNMNVGDMVRIRPHKLGENKWKLGRIRKQVNDRSYEVEQGDVVYRRNKRHLI